jgi:hypothetical protein
MQNPRRGASIGYHDTLTIRLNKRSTVRSPTTFHRIEGGVRSY